MENEKIASFQTFPSFVDVIESSLSRLTSMLLADRFAAESHRQYGLILKCYLESDQVKLQDCLNALKVNSEIYKISLLRYQNLVGQRSFAAIDDVLNIARGDSIWAGEAAFALGMTFFRFKQNTEAHNIFKIAHKKLSIIGAHKKAVKALLNVVVADSRIDNRQHLIHDYEIVATKAQAIGDKIIQGVCYQNIAKEMHSLGAFQAALRYSHRAIELQGEDFGSLHYFESILQRCHILIDMGRFKEAYSDFEQAKVSTHSQVKEALKCIEKLLGDGPSIALESVEPAWRTKLARQDYIKPRLTKLEADFIDLIKGQKIHRDEIIRCLYGSEIDWFSAKNRFKVFLSRFRSKFPDTVVEEGDFFSLAEVLIWA